MRSRRERVFRGLRASPGIAIGEIYMVNRRDPSVTARSIEPKQVDSEIKRFRQAISEAKAELIELKRKVSESLGEGHAMFLDAQLLILDDVAVIKDTEEKIKKERRNAESVFYDTVQRAIDRLSGVGDTYLRERTLDLKDVSRRVLCHLDRSCVLSFTLPEKEVVVVADDLTPSDTAKLHGHPVLGFATQHGGTVSHAAIMARALEIPAVVGLSEDLKDLGDGDKIIVDGNSGIVIINPKEEVLKNYGRGKRRYERFREHLMLLRDQPATTLDGRSVELSANIEMPGEVTTAIARGAKGIGLYRTEFLFLAGDRMPSEEEQYAAYATVAERVYPESVIVRTLDIGGDKVVGNLREPNPFMGWRAIRISLSQTEMFKMQLRAILRASVKENVKIMFPMISMIEELRQARSVLEEAKSDLRKKGIPFQEQVEVGIMVETPAAALSAAYFARECDFLSIGSNDLTQYTMAVDRTNERVAYLYDHLHPSILSLIKGTVNAAHANDIWVGVCGEMAGDPLAVPVLLGLDVDELSTSPIVLLETKKIIRGLHSDEARSMAEKAISLDSPVEVRSYLREQFRRKFPDLAKVLLPGRGEGTWKD
ncbi:MAG: phosphoenolpyruvate--protein phosphotransferase [bacterium]